MDVRRIRRRVTAGVQRRVRRLGRRWAGPPAARLVPPPSGIVEEFTADHISGWVAVPEDAPPVKVRLLLNDLDVTGAWAAAPRSDRESSSGEIRRFDLKVRDLWDFAGPKDRLRILADGRPLPIVGYGTRVVPERAGRRTPADLAASLEAGQIFAQNGRLQLSKKHDTAWQASTMALYREVADLVAAERGYDVFLFYGSLLGAVREGAVIGHDVDFDAAYVSRHSHPREAALELQALGLLLVDRGYHVRCAYTSLHVYARDGSGTRLDLFHTYFDADDVLCLPFGQAGTVDVTRADWRGTQEIRFCGAPALIPANAEQMAGLLYGTGWRSPQPGFDWTRECAKRDWRGVLTAPDVQEVYWADFYTRTQFEDPSPFAAELLARPDLPSLVVDLGCGEGRDALAFAASGRTVLGLDRSHVGVRQATSRAAERGVGDRTRFVVADLGYTDRVAAELERALAETDGPTLFHLRFVLHAVTGPVQELLLGTLAEHARPGDLLAVEFRTARDEGRRKAFGQHPRRLQDGPAFGEALRQRYGFTVLAEQAGTGLSPYGPEDPELYRVVARCG